MKKVVILGCENSHATTFLKLIETGQYPEIEIVGIFSDDLAAAQRLNERFNVPVLKEFDELKDSVDGAIITARHGDKHYKFAKPYIKKGRTLFIDKPITISEQEALLLVQEIKSQGALVTGGSCCKHLDTVKTIKRQHQNNENGKTLSGFVRAPIQMKSPHGNFFFYGQHGVEMALEAFGFDVLKVQSTKQNDNVTATLFYKDFQVNLLFVESNYLYCACRTSENDILLNKEEILENSPCFKEEFDEFYNLLLNGNQKISLNDFIKPVFVMNAISRSLISNREEPVIQYII